MRVLSLFSNDYVVVAFPVVEIIRSFFPFFRFYYEKDITREKDVGFQLCRKTFTMKHFSFGNYTLSYMCSICINNSLKF